MENSNNFNNFQKCTYDAYTSSPFQILEKKKYIYTTFISSAKCLSFFSNPIHKLNKNTMNALIHYELYKYKSINN